MRDRLEGKEAALVPKDSERDMFVTLRGSSSIVENKLDEEDVGESPLLLG